MRTRATGDRPALVTVDGVDRPVHGAQVAIIEGGRVLVQFRPWPPGWELPGGHCDDGEEPVSTAAREAQEETGLRVRITALVGVYSWSGLRTSGDALYLGEITGGRRRWNIEAWATRMVPPEHLPRTTFPWYRQRVADAVATSRGAGPVYRVQQISMYHVLAFATAWTRVPLDHLQRWLRRRHGPR